MALNSFLESEVSLTKMTSHETKSTSANNFSPPLQSFCTHLVRVRLDPEHERPDIQVLKNGFINKQGVQRLHQHFPPCQESQLRGWLAHKCTEHQHIQKNLT